MIRRLFISLALSLGVTATMAQTAPVAPDQLVKQMSTDVLEAAKADKAVQAGDLNRVVALVDAKVLPFLDFQRMTSTAVGRFWRQATPEQQKRLQDEFKLLLTRSYAGALSQVKNVNIIMKPLRADAADTEVVVKTEIRGKGDPIMLDYRLAKQADGAVLVRYGETVAFRGANGEQFAWTFNGLDRRSVDVQKIAPAGFTAAGVRVYIDRDPSNRN